jgi:uncharacterized damage-inducible protein DinB
LHYDQIAISDSEVPRAAVSAFQYLLKTYASEANKLNSVWLGFTVDDLQFKPDERSRTVGEIIEHELLSQRRFFGEFLGLPEPPANEVLPATKTPQAYAERMIELSRRRLAFMATQAEDWWFTIVPFFDVQRERIWVFWRRVLHTAHHRAQLGVYLRLAGRKVPAIYGPSADETWEGADPTSTVAAASRK